MLTITAEQLEAMSGAADAQAREALVAYARARFPSLATDVPDLVSRVRGAASRIGLTRTEHVATLVDLAAMYGDQVLEAAWLVDALRQPGFEPDEVFPVLEATLQRAGVPL